MRIVGEAVTGRTPASPNEVHELLEAAIRDSDTSVRREAIGSIASILQLNAMPAVPDGQQWVVSLREVAEASLPGQHENTLEATVAKIRAGR